MLRQGYFYHIFSLTKNFSSSSRHIVCFNLLCEGEERRSRTRRYNLWFTIHKNQCYRLVLNLKTKSSPKGRYVFGNSIVLTVRSSVVFQYTYKKRSGFVANRLSGLRKRTLQEQSSIEIKYNSWGTDFWFLWTFCRLSAASTKYVQLVRDCRPL